jgi:hypothetical protein
MVRLRRSPNNERLVSLAKDFSRHPGPRYKAQGKDSGEQFRKRILSWLKDSDLLLVDLDGTSGIGSSFIDEAFGGLIFAEGMTPDEVRRRIKVKSDLDASYLLDFEDSIARAAAAKQISA